MPEKEWNLFSIMQALIGKDSGMIFGPTGSGKSMLVRSVMQSAVQQNHKVAMCDTEANYIEEDIEWLEANSSYTHVTSLDGIVQWVKGLSKGFALIVVDSIGGPAYGEFTRSNMRQSGDVFKKVAEAAFEIQQYCQQNKSMALVVNQPTSELNLAKSKEQEPFGGKGGFYSKEVLKTVPMKPDKGWSFMKLEVFKSRHMGKGLHIATVAISNKWVGVKFLKYEGRKPEGWPETECKIPNPAMGASGPEETEEVKDKTKDKTNDEPVVEMEVPQDGEEAQEDSLETLTTAIHGLIDVKGVDDELFKRLMYNAEIEIESPDQINDQEIAQAVKVVLEGYPGKKKEPENSEELQF